MVFQMITEKRVKQKMGMAYVSVFTKAQSAIVHVLLVVTSSLPS